MTLKGATGRLSLYFQNEYRRLIGRSSTLAAALEALSTGPLRLADLARRIGAAAGSTAHYVERLGDSVRRNGDGRYELADRTFALWVQWRSPGGTVVPMTVIGDEAEVAVSEYLARLGFDLVYQSRASRGAFDLLATRGSLQLGIQVKRQKLPLRFTKTEWRRMTADAQRLGWRWAVGAVSGEFEVIMLDPNKARRGREIRLNSDAMIENLLLWLDHDR